MVVDKSADVENRSFSDLHIPTDHSFCPDNAAWCNLCCWAFPEKYKPIRIPGPLIERLRAYAKRIGGSPDQIVTDLITEELDSHQ